MSKKIYASVLQTKQTPQNTPIPGRENDQVKNNTGGFVFAVTPFTQLERFLILGSDAPTYYATEQKLTKDSAENVRKCLALDGNRTVDMIVEVSTTARAPKNDPALFALAVASSVQFSTPKTVQYALAQLSKVARTGTDFMIFTEFVNGMRGWGRSLKRAEAEWYTNRSERDLAYTLIKYQNREGWSNRDLLRLSHAKTSDPRKAALLAWATRGGLEGLKEASGKWGEGLADQAKTAEARERILAEIPVRQKRFAEAYSLLTGETANRLVTGYEAAKKATTAKEIVSLINEFKLTREMIPTNFLNEVSVWEALLPHMKMTALIRNLGKMSNVGLLKPLSTASQFVAEKLTKEAEVRHGMIHPLKALLAQGVYRLGHGMKGNLTWSPVPTIIDALEETFYLAFQNVVPTGKPQYIGLDCSGSMKSNFIPSAPGISCAQAAAAMAMVTARTEKNYCIYGFASNGNGYGGRWDNGNAVMKEVGITAKDTLESAMKKVDAVNMGGTDCSLPMRHAQENNLNADAFIVITDNETWAGNIHPTQALKNYRSHVGRQDVKLVVMACTPVNFSIADPNDPFNLDVVGFDGAAPAVIADFIRGGAGKPVVDDEE